MKSEKVLQEAIAVIKARETQHGNKRANLTRIAALWSAYMGAEISPYAVADMMELLKIARRLSGEFNADDYVDGAGYAALAAEARTWG